MCHQLMKLSWQAVIDSQFIKLPYPPLSPAQCSWGNVSCGFIYDSWYLQQLNAVLFITCGCAVKILLVSLMTGMCLFACWNVELLALGPEWRRELWGRYCSGLGTYYWLMHGSEMCLCLACSHFVLSVIAVYTKLKQIQSERGLLVCRHQYVMPLISEWFM